MAEFETKYNHGGSCIACFDGYPYRSGRYQGKGRGGPAVESHLPSDARLQDIANSSSAPLVVFVDMQQEYLAKPRPLASSEIDRVIAHFSACPLHEAG